MHTYPATSRVISLTNAVLLDKNPFLREIFTAGCLGVTSVKSYCKQWFLAWYIGAAGVKERTVAGVEAEDKAWELLVFCALYYAVYGAYRSAA